MKKLAAAAALGLLAVLLFWSFPRDAPTPGEEASRRPSLSESHDRSRAKRLRESATHSNETSDERADTASIAGRVLDRVSGAPIVGASIAVDDPDGRSQALTSAAQGRFLLEHAAPGVHVLLGLEAEGYLPWTGEELWSLKAGDRLEGLTLMLTPAVAYKGLVVDEAKRPVADAEVRVLGAPGVLRSDARGEFMFHAADEALLEARHPKLGFARARVDRTVLITHRLTLTLKKEGDIAMRAVEGVVVDGSGHPIAGASVQVLVRDDTLSTFAPLTRSDHQGHFRFDAVDAVFAAVRAWAEGFVEGSVSLPADESGPLRIVLNDACPVDVLVQGSESSAETTLALGASAPIPNAVRVPSAELIVLEGKGIAPSPVYWKTVVPDGLGRATIAGFGPGEYQLELHAAGFAPSTTPMAFTVPVGCGEVTLSGTLGRGYTLRGEVVEEGTLAPLPWASVGVENREQEETHSDADGHFELRGISAGPKSIYVSAKDHNARILGPLVFSGAFPERHERAVLSKVAEGEKPMLELAGIGVGMTARDDQLEITQVLPGGGADNAGLKVGDRVTAVDGQDVTALGFDGAMQQIRGPVGTPVRLSLVRSGAKTEITVTRTKIRA